MTMKLINILNLHSNVKIIIDDTTTKIDALLKFKLLGILKSLEVHNQNFETVRNEKILEYGEENENGGFSVPLDNPEKLDGFNTDIQKLLDSEIEIDIKKIKAVDIIDKGLSADYLMALYDIIEE